MDQKLVPDVSIGCQGLPLKFVLGLVFSLVFCAESPAQMTTVAYDGFNYAAGSLAGQNGGTGWTSSWINDYTSGASFQVSLNGMSYSGLATSGGSLAWESGGNGISEDNRSLPRMDSGVVYLQFLGEFASNSGGGTPNIRLLNSGSLTGGFGGNGGTHGSVMSILDTSLQPAANGASSSPAPLSSLNLVIARIDYQNDVTTMWVNPNLSTFDYLNPSNPNAIYAGLAPAFDSISIYSRSPADVDEIAVMVVPEPTSTSLLLAGAGAMLFYGWRRRGARVREGRIAASARL
jgi:hypothetical protein